MPPPKHATSILGVPPIAPPAGRHWDVPKPADLVRASTEQLPVLVAMAKWRSARITNLVMPQGARNPVHLTITTEAGAILGLDLKQALECLLVPTNEGIR